MVVQFRCVKSELPLHCNDDAGRNPWRWQIFLGDGRSKVPLPSIDFLSCGVGCEFHHHHDCNCAAGGRRKFPVPQRASIGSHHTIAELAQCSLINCWSHVQNVTRGPWPCMQAREMGVGCAYGPIYLCQVWPSGRRAPWRFLRQKRELAQHEIAGGGF